MSSPPALAGQDRTRTSRIATAWAPRACCRARAWTPPSGISARRSAHRSAPLSCEVTALPSLRCPSPLLPTRPSLSLAALVLARWRTAPLHARSVPDDDANPRGAALWPLAVLLDAGGPVDAVETAMHLAPNTYHIDTQFDKVVTGSSFAATMRRQNQSNKGLHAQYSNLTWLPGAGAHAPAATQRPCPRPPKVLGRRIPRPNAGSASATRPPPSSFAGLRVSPWALRPSS